MPGKKLLYRQALAPRLLQFTDGQRPLPTGNEHLLAIHCQHFPGLPLTDNRTGQPELDQLPAKAGLSARKRVEGAQMTIQFGCRLPPVNQGFGLFYLVGVGNTGFRLNRRRARSVCFAAFFAPVTLLVTL